MYTCLWDVYWQIYDMYDQIFKADLKCWYDEDCLHDLFGDMMRIMWI